MKNELLGVKLIWFDEEKARGKLEELGRNVLKELDVFTEDMSRIEFVRKLREHKQYIPRKEWEITKRASHGSEEFEIDDELLGFKMEMLSYDNPLVEQLVVDKVATEHSMK